MLIVIAGDGARFRVAKHLIDHHRFVGRTTLPKLPLPRGARVVVVPDVPDASFRARMTLARRTHKLGGILVWLDPRVPAMEVTLPDPRTAGVGEEAALREVDALVAMCSGCVRR